MSNDGHWLLHLAAVMAIRVFPRPRFRHNSRITDWWIAKPPILTHFRAPCIHHDDWESSRSIILLTRLVTGKVTDCYAGEMSPVTRGYEPQLDSDLPPAIIASVRDHLRPLKQPPCCVKPSTAQRYLHPSVNLGVFPFVLFLLKTNHSKSLAKHIP